METTQNSELVEGLESMTGSSQPVTDIGDFLSLDQLGIDLTAQTDGLDFEEVELIDKKEPEEDKLDLDELDPTKDSDEVKPTKVDIDLEEINDIPTGFDYKSVVEELVGNGIWEPIGAFETEQGEVPFEDMDIDKDTFIALMKHNQEELKTKLTSSTVSTEGISEFTQKLISIEKHGGNVQEALNAYQTIKEPLENIDITDVRGQRAVCYLRLQQQGISGEEAKDLIETYERKGVLEDKATNFKDQLDSAFNEWMLKKEEEAINEEKAYKESLKAYKSTLNEALKNAKEFELSETHRKKLLEIATKETEGGSFELDNLIDDHRRNPNDAADLILFLTDKDNFIKKKAKLLLDEQNKSTLKKISIIPKGKSGVDLKMKSTKGDDLLLALDKLK